MRIQLEKLERITTRIKISRSRVANTRDGKVNSSPVPSFKGMEGHISIPVQWSDSLSTLGRKRKSRDKKRERECKIQSTPWGDRWLE